MGVLGAAGLLLVNRMGQAARAVPEPAERFVLADLGRFSASFWYILALNVLFASVFFPFRSTFSIQYFQDVKGISLAEAGIANSWVFVAAIFATPVFGLVADRFGRRASLLVLGAALMPVTFVLLAFTNASLWVSTALMGLSFSVIPAVIWPATAMLVDRRRIGTAYGVINMLQSAGMTVVNYLAGALNDAYAAGPGHPQGYNPMLVMFAGLSVVSLVATLALRARECRLPGGGIEAR